MVFILVLPIALAAALVVRAITVDTIIGIVVAVAFMFTFTAARTGILFLTLWLLCCRVCSEMRLQRALHHGGRWCGDGMV
jgi:hypothetical protein